ncbi:hypothetical protein QYE76_036526 [Lolium multiflorum]|uniref:Splicing factor cactin central domain-containing protein n=1 Tax=Lolium multiflorum TaxID=4521 RepID=A0AAD8R524_LOLMU|nr:hypothetical protein QYE76_036526 [Lolium multiflorum]
MGCFSCFDSRSDDERRYPKHGVPVRHGRRFRLQRLALAPAEPEPPPPQEPPEGHPVLLQRCERFPGLGLRVRLRRPPPEEELERQARGVTEEQIVEYMSKKAQKKAEKVAKKMKGNAVSGYSNDSNPFGDPNLTENFVWRKKIERAVTEGQTVDISVKTEKKKMRDRMAEIEKVKKRREERAIEKAQHEEEMALLARERARAEFQDWEKKEEEFHFDQSKFRSEIRLREQNLLMFS